MPVQHGDDPAHLLAHQYADSRNLAARMALHERFSVNPKPLRQWLFDRLRDVPADARVLEVGCGPGTLWVENRERIPPGWQLHLTDFSPGMAAEAEAALAQAGITAEVSVADACELPFADGSADLVLAHGMLYHVADRPRALAELRRVLADGGQLHAWTVGADHLLRAGRPGPAVGAGAGHRRHRGQPVRPGERRRPAGGAVPARAS